MDFAQFDQRGRDDRGMPFPVLHPVTREPILDGDMPCRVLVKGPSAPSVTRHQHDRLMAAMLTPKPDEPTPQTPDDAHRDLVAAALARVAGFENMTRDGAPMTAADAEWWLNMTFPMMGPDPDSPGAFKMLNHPFAVQVLQYAREVDEALGNG